MRFEKGKAMIAPSILSADFSRIGEEVSELKKAGADIIHCDVMDGHFVSNITFGAKFVKDLRKIVDLPYDVHLMISEPEKYAGDFIDAGADSITFHYEALNRPAELLSQIRAAKVMCGLALSPDTPVSAIRKYIPMCDIILVMSVYPGFGGQKFIEATYSKLTELKEITSKESPNTLIEIDGGVTISNAEKIKKCGVDILVAGNAVFCASDKSEAVKKLRNF